MKKHGKLNNFQRYFCHQCHKTFTFKKKLDPIKIWSDYACGKQTYQQLAIKYHCSVRTIQRYIDKSLQNTIKITSKSIPEHYYGYHLFWSLFWCFSADGFKNK
ncbi:hypothetical protein [Gallibacterium anatis]|uniref:hypothetical protein n=1 Tax=Gallibacterium anatis TaxID=750 RepID=UPI0039FD9E99